MTDFLDQYGYIAIFLALLLENTIVVGVFFPGLAVLIAGGYFAGTGDLNFFAVLLIAWLGVIGGDGVGFFLGRFGLNRLHFVETLLERHEAQARRLSETRSPALLFFQFPMPTRTAIPIIAGAIRMPVRRWLTIDALATTIFTVSVGTIGFMTGRLAGTITEAQKWGVRVQVLFVLLFLAWCIRLFWKLTMGKRRAKKSDERLSRAPGP